ncbi:energy-coupling factor transporter transmembrane component T family protein [Desulforamulus ferrireducens]|uniref:Cobalt transporter n=1 Tax=Desulforamulus ferrireducens TaxID=1833852 RepID=A0A1S6IV52_9FIRM|nr:energy-coupling factor transporter transmembrane component T [Desulforamulus ferrireducens]AQS58654.1 cobalt transporter [Desulforamulus ferrireducens]
MARVVEYIHRDSLVHQLNPLSKLAWALGVMVLALTFNHPYYLLGLFFFVGMVGLMGRVLKDLMFVMKGLSIFALILVLLQVIFYQGAYREAITLGLAMGLRMMTVVLSFLIFLSTTQYKDIILVLTEKLKLPYDYVFMFMTSLRFVPTFLNEAIQVGYAQRVRGCPIDSGNPFRKIKAYIAVSLPLVLISLKKAEGLAIAMETRGFGSSNRTYYKEPLVRPVDYLVIFLVVVLIVTAIFLRFKGLGVLDY